MYYYYYYYYYAAFNAPCIGQKMTNRRRRPIWLYSFDSYNCKIGGPVRFCVL